MEEKEIWKDIEGFEGLYQVSNMGRVKSVKRTVWDSRGCYRTVPEKILKPRKERGDYLMVGLYKDARGKNYKIHRLVAIAFCENPENYNEVNHINEDKSDNRAINLEWCSRSYNNTYNDRAKKVGKKIGKKLRGRKQSEESIKKRVEKLTNNPKLSKPVIAIHKINGLILEFSSAHEAERETGIDHSNIIKCCQGKKNSCGGFYWMYANNNDDAE